jgi:predicted ATP-grasp superfamily ATP-dependent carboligase
MPSRSHARSSETHAAVLIVAASGRALAAAARRAGFRPLALDYFGDADTRALCDATQRIEGGYHSGFTAENLIPALKELADGKEPCGAVYGAGFEDRPELLELIARHWPLIGNKPDTVRCAKEPVQLSSVCARLRIPHPEISLTMPADPHCWLAKDAGGAGGMHVRPAAGARLRDATTYFQREAEGEAVSVQFLADGAKACVIGLTRQWAAPAPGAPFRFGGVLRPAIVSPKIDRALRQATANIARAFALRGLNTIDCLITDEAYTLIEINPRPGAALDIFEDPDGLLFRAHIDASRGRLPGQPLEFPGAAAAAIAYAREPVACVPKLRWPAWTADRPASKSALRAGDPLCTIKAHSAEPSSARARAEARINLLLDRLTPIQNQKSNNGKETTL